MYACLCGGEQTRSVDPAHHRYEMGRLCNPIYNASAKEITMGTILLIVLVLLLIGAIPSWPHSRGWGYAPSGLIGLVLLVMLIMVLLGKI